MAEDETAASRARIYISDKLRPSIRAALLARIQMLRGADVDDETLAKFLGDYCTSLVALAVLHPEKLTEIPE